MNIALTDINGRAYGRKPGTADSILTEVGPGTLGGELLRRYWQPIAISAEATDLPKQIRRFGEELILFRNGQGEAGLVTPNCIHRGASLLYGKVEADGIRCCYHGWKFNCQGVVLEQPGEPDGGRAKHKIRQPWYPVIERFGAIWAYMGPPEKQPLFPEFSCFDNLGEDEEIVASYINDSGVYGEFPARFSWFQEYDNAIDHYHLVQLHCKISGLQFSDDRFLVDPQLDWQLSAARNSVLGISKREIGDGKVYLRIEEALLPNFQANPSPFEDGPSQEMMWIVPLDDRTHVRVQIRRSTKGFVWSIANFAGLGDERKLWGDLTPEEHQRAPGDYEAMSSMGENGIVLHSHESLASTDRGVVMLRNQWKRQAKLVAEGGDPLGVAFTEAERRLVITGGSAVVPAEALEHETAEAIIRQAADGRVGHREEGRRAPAA